MPKTLFLNEDNKEFGEVNGKYSFDWVENTAMVSDDKIIYSHSVPETTAYIGKSVSKTKIAIFAFFIMIGLLIVLSRAFYLQVYRGMELSGLAEINRIRILPIVSERGVVYDRNKKQLVQNVPNFSLAITPQDINLDSTKKQNLIDEISALSGVSQKEINDILIKYGKYSYSSVIIKENLDYESALKAYIKSSALPGVSIIKGSKRQYRLTDNVNINYSSSTDNIALSLSHIYGYLNKLNEKEYENLKNDGYLLFDNIGKSGVEKTYEKELRGSYGRKKVEVDARGKEINILTEEAPKPGKNLILSIDLTAQEKMEEYLSKQLKKSGVEKASGIAINPNNGEIVALVSLPSYDSNDFSGGITYEKYKKYENDINQPLFNRAIGGTYPSGSIIKLIIATAALEEKIVTPHNTFFSSGGLQVGRWFFKDWLAGGHGTTNITKAIAWSVNTYFYYVGGGYENFVGLGVDKINEYFQIFGLGKKTKIDLTNENSGFIPSKNWKMETKNENWFVGDTYNLSIGQGDLLVTPLQAAVWTSVVANGGFMIQPHVVKSFEDRQSNKVTDLVFKPRKISASDDNLSIVRQGMRECVTAGSCKMLASLPFSAAGKTGTAQWNSNKNDHAWFTSFAPLDNPQIVVTILIEEGKEGASAAQPVALNFLKWWGEKYLK